MRKVRRKKLEERFKADGLPARAWRMFKRCAVRKRPFQWGVWVDPRTKRGVFVR